MEPEPTARRGPWLAISVATVVAIGLIGVLSLAFFMPIEPDCFEWCGLGRIFALAGISFVGFAWLLVFVTVAWRDRARSPGVAVLSAAVAATASAALAVMVSIPWSPDSSVYTFFQLVTLLGSGVALPAAWRIARRSPRRSVAGLATAAMTAAVGIGIVAYVALGTTWWTDGPTVQWVAIIGWSIALAVLVLASWRGTWMTRAALALLAIGATLEAGIGVLALGFHVASGGLAVTPYLVTSAGWGLLALAWKRAEVTTDRVIG
jgi:hypothetical protein